MKNNALTTHGSNKFLKGFFSVALNVIIIGASWLGFSNVAQADNKMPSSPDKDSSPHALVVTAPATQQLNTPNIADILELPIVSNAQPAEAPNTLKLIAPEPTVIAATPSQPTAVNENRLSDQEKESRTPRELIPLSALQQDLSTKASDLRVAPSNTTVQPSQFLSRDDTTGAITLGNDDASIKFYPRPEQIFTTNNTTFGVPKTSYISPAVETCATDNGVKSCEYSPAGKLSVDEVGNGISMTLPTDLYNKWTTRTKDPFVDTTSNILNNTRFGNGGSAVTPSSSLGGGIPLVSLSPTPSTRFSVGSNLSSINVNGSIAIVPGVNVGAAFQTDGQHQAFTNIRLGSNFTVTGSTGSNGSSIGLSWNSGSPNTTVVGALPLTTEQQEQNSDIENMKKIDDALLSDLRLEALVQSKLPQQLAQLSASKVQNPPPHTQTEVATPTRPSPLLTRNDVARLVPDALRKNPEATLKLLQQSLGNASRGIIAAYKQTGSAEEAARVASLQIPHLTAQLLPLATQPAGLASLAERLQKLANPPTVTTENARPQAATGTAMLASLQKLRNEGGLSQDEYDEICMRAGHFPGTGAPDPTRRLVIDAVRVTLNLSAEQNPAEALRKRADAARVIAAMQNNNAQNG